MLIVLMVVSVCASVVLLASVILDSLLGEIVSLGLHAAGYLTLEQLMVALIGLLSF